MKSGQTTLNFNTAQAKTYLFDNDFTNLSEQNKSACEKSWRLWAQIQF